MSSTAMDPWAFLTRFGPKPEPKDRPIEIPHKTCALPDCKRCDSIPKIIRNLRNRPDDLVYIRLHDPSKTYVLWIPIKVSTLSDMAVHISHSEESELRLNFKKAQPQIKRLCRGHFSQNRMMNFVHKKACGGLMFAPGQSVNTLEENIVSNLIHGAVLHDLAFRILDKTPLRITRARPYCSCSKAARENVKSLEGLLDKTNDPEPFMCSGCRSRYCSEKCYLEDWPNHKEFCQREQKRIRKFQDNKCFQKPLETTKQLADIFETVRRSVYNE